MKYEINSSDINFSGSDFKTFFTRINDACSVENVSYYVVGAFARDIILENIFKQSSGVATKDIDVAIEIDSWENYDKFVNYLKTKHNFTEGKNPHEYISPEGVFTDIIPYGGIEKNRLVSFPPNYSKEINMLGFEEIHSSAINIVLDNEIEFRIASIEGIAILKLIAWQDRMPGSSSEKHSRDLGLIIDSYFDPSVEQIADDFADLFDVDEFNSTICGARSLGRRIKLLINSSDHLKNELESLFSEILKDEENSLFISQLTNSTLWDYNFALQVVKNFALGFSEI